MGIAAVYINDVSVFVFRQVNFSKSLSIDEDHIESGMLDKSREELTKLEGDRDR